MRPAPVAARAIAAPVRAGRSRCCTSDRHSTGWLAPREGGRRVLLRRRVRRVSPDPPDQRPDFGNAGLSDPAGEETLVADAVEPVGQDVPEEAADELAAPEPHHLHPVAMLDAVVLPAERHRRAVGADQAAVRDRDTMGVTSETGQHGPRSAEGRLGVVSKPCLRHDDHPVHPPERRQPGAEGAGIGEAREVAEERQAFQKEAAEQPGQDFHRQEEPGAARDPSRPDRRQAAARQGIACDARERARSCGCGGDASAPIPGCAAPRSCRPERRDAGDRQRWWPGFRQTSGTAGHRRPSCSRTRSARFPPGG